MIDLYLFLYAFSLIAIRIVYYPDEVFLKTACLSITRKNFLYVQIKGAHGVEELLDFQLCGKVSRQLIEFDDST